MRSGTTWVRSLPAARGPRTSARTSHIALWTHVKMGPEGTDGGVTGAWYGYVGTRAIITSSAAIDLDMLLPPLKYVPLLCPHAKSRKQERLGAPIEEGAPVLSQERRDIRVRSGRLTKVFLVCAFTLKKKRKASLLAAAS